mmetsp:Transcript_102850/g.219951  ORF Transcript_102850/g.219951 Transcript_102850/m.219951 type:complete len:518 (-) Transcript_102850:197-1750(-)
MASSSAKVGGNVKVHPVDTDVQAEELSSKEEETAEVKPKGEACGADFARTNGSTAQTNLFGFTDIENIKEKVKRSLLKKEPYSVFIYYKSSGIWQWLAKHPTFENATLAVITLNAIYIAVDTDWNKPEPCTPTKSNSLQEAGTFFVFMEHAFCLYFTAEWIVRFMAFKNKLNCRKDAWFVFDSLLVFMMVMETWVLIIVMAFASGEGGSPVGGTGILRLFRLLRLSRLMRMLRSLPELMILIKGMVTAMKSVFYVMCLLVILLYVFAIAFTQLTVDSEIGDVYFTNVSLSMYSLLIHATFLDDLAGFMNDIRNEMWPLLVLALVFIALAALTVMNMLIGVLCEVVTAVANTEREEIRANQVSEQLQSIVQSLDANNDGTISYEEFTQIIEKPDALRALNEVEVNPLGLIDFAEISFFEDGEPKDLSFEAFMDMVLDLRESNTATVKDLLKLWMQVRSSSVTTIRDAKTTAASLSTVLDQTTKELTEKLDQKTQTIEDQLASVLSEVRKITSQSRVAG